MRVLAVAVFTLLVPASAAAAERVTTAPGLAGAPELVGARVAWQEQRCLGGCIDSVDCGPGGTRFGYAVRLGAPRRATRTLFRRRLRCAASGPNTLDETATAAVSVRRVVVGERTSRSDEAGTDRVTARLRAGAHGGPLGRLLSCTAFDGRGTHGSFEFALDGDAVAYDADACGESRRWTVRELASGREHLVPQPPLSSLYSPRLAGRYFAFLRSPFTLVVWDWVAGAAAYSVTLPPSQYPQSLDVAADGTVAVLTRDPGESTNTCATERIRWLSPAEPFTHELPARPCRTSVRIAAGSAFFVAESARRRALKRVTLAGAQRTLARFGRIAGAGFDADGPRAAFALRTCGGGQAIYRIGVAERTFNTGSERCPAAISSRALHRRGGVVGLTLSCPRACAGHARIRRGSSTIADKAFGSERRGRKTVPMRLPAGTRAGAVTAVVSVEERDGRRRTLTRRLPLR